ncbi:hypothetical protein TK90_2691 (plasmid) [Thioalkalivibrio sp. K90mix]|uniref:hypothetical protein n=1 Tax=Thioalkalivibrio sp. (strain K90mix) TaxID=396595 RepID=UPI000195A444|nr:hypothetical protein [Thioalkalivibrio sp. K90mix]ADC73177.1 hypothetical protein TK90_2691 [Thioalkalivibrio sp. K90mix]
MTAQALAYHPTFNAAEECEHLASRFGAPLVQPLVRSIVDAIGPEALGALEAPSPHTSPRHQARFLVKVLGEDNALRAIEGSIREQEHIRPKRHLSLCKSA